jgi:hypothetical protein
MKGTEKSRFCVALRRAAQSMQKLHGSYVPAALDRGGFESNMRIDGSPLAGLAAENIPPSL